MQKALVASVLALLALPGLVNVLPCAAQTSVWPGAADQPSVIYSLRLLELSTDVAKRIDTSLSLSIPATGLPWSLTADQRVLNLAGDFAEVTGTTETETWGAKYSTWMVTLEGETAAARIREEEISTDLRLSNREMLSCLEIALTPRRIDLAGELVLTDLNLRYADAPGALTTVKSTVFVGMTPGKPLAVLSQRLDAKERGANRYFALFVSARIIPASSLPGDKAVAIGNVGGLQSFMASGATTEAASRWSLAWTSNNGMRASLSGPFGEAHRLAATVELSDWGTLYEVEYGYSLHEGLSFVSRWEESAAPSPGSIVLGFADSLPLSKAFTVQVAWSPARFDLRHGRLTRGTRWEATTRWTIDSDWDVEAGLRRGQGYLGNKQYWFLGLTLRGR